MGGYGSGRGEWVSAKGVTEHFRALDMCYFTRNKLLGRDQQFRLTWRQRSNETGSVLVGVERNRLVLIYRYGRSGGEWQDVRQSVTLTTTLCHYGGQRYWFRCPANGCGRRVLKLYGAGPHFACRKCYDLRYQSQRENRGDRALRVCQDIRERLGGSRSLAKPFPEKPKGMHWRTYNALRARAKEAEAVSWTVLAERLHIRAVDPRIRADSVAAGLTGEDRDADAESATPTSKPL